ncbi:MAG TPA: glutathione S-transferase family protein [Gaiellales bacterium]
MTTGLHLYAIPYSTNVERVALALGHKGLAAEVIMSDPADRSTIREASGQDLVPALDDDGFVVVDSSRIIEHLERRFPDPPLFPAEPARRAEVRVFVEWFDRVWKRPPNAIDAELGKQAPDHIRIAALEHELRATLDVFETMLDGRDYLMSGSLTAADCAAFPFLKYGLWIEPSDDERFHHILAQNLALDGDHPRLDAWVRRVSAHPRVDGIVTYDG